MSRIGGSAVDTDVAVLYQKYLAYMADVRHGCEILRAHARWLPLPDTLTFAQFEGMWQLAGRHPELRERWLRRLTYGYEQERLEIAASLAEIHAPRRAALQAKQAA